MNELALFAGAGGGILGGKLLGWRTVCAVEIDSYARRVLLARQADGCLEPFPVWDDVATFDGHRWRGSVDVVSGGFPCQDISAAGKGAGLDGERSGLWAEMARIVSEVQPAFVWVENSPMLVIRGLDRVLWDLAALGYDARWGVVAASHAGAVQKRERLWIVARPAEVGFLLGDVPARELCAGALDCVSAGVRESLIRDEDLPADLRAHYGLAGWVDRLACTGNGQVPAVVRLAWETLTAGLGMSNSNPKADTRGTL